ncbi:MAG TPA: hypothetical protein VFJ16_14675 [Longimicrobium sp.]|nr:hypothetical protein [Longimicrobium sp.]
MRNQLALAFVLAAAAAPAHAQRPLPVYHGEGYDIVLPAKCRPAVTESSREDGDRTRTYLFGGENTFVVVVRYAMAEISDTSMATRRAMLQLARVGMMQASGDVTLLGDLRDIQRDDRLGMRVAVSMPPDKERNFTMYGIAEMSIARQGNPELWMVMVMDRRRDAGTGVAGERVLDSFRLADPAVAGNVIRGFQEAAPKEDAARKPQG